MYSVSDAFRAAMKLPAQEWDIKGTIDSVAFTRQNIVANSFSITNDCSGQDRLEIGSVTIGVLTAKFIGLDIAKYTWRGRKITPQFGLKLASGSFEYIPLGVFTIIKVNHTESGVEVTAYDAMSALDSPIGVSLSGGVQRTLTPEEFADFRVFSDLTATAQWTAKTCTVTFWVRYDSMTPKPDPVTVPYGSTLDLTQYINPSSSNYVSIGWAAAVYGPVITSVTVTDDITIYAQDKHVGEYSVLYGNIPEPYRGHVDAGEPFVEPATAPTKTGYTFIEWQLNGTAYDFTTPSSGDIELTAAWTPNVTHTVSFMDGSTVLSTQTVVNNETASRPANPTKSGVYFAGWVNSREAAYDFSTAVTADLPLYATWSETPCTVTLNAGSGYVSPASVTLGFGGTVGELNTLFYTGYICTGWSVNNDGMTAYHIASTGCSMCGVQLGSTQAEIEASLNGAFVLSFQVRNNAATWRDVFAWLGELLCGFFTGGRDGKLYFRQFGRTVADTVDETHRWTGCKFADYEARFSAIQIIAPQVQETENGEETVERTFRFALLTDDAACFTIRDNPFLNSADEITLTRYGYNILQTLQALRYVPFQASMTGNPVFDLGDCLRFTGGIADDTKISCITRFTFRHGAAFQISGAGLGAEEEAESAGKSGGTTPSITPSPVTPEEIANRDIIRIEWTTAPNKTTYYAGEYPAYSGSVITAFFTDGGVGDVTTMCDFYPRNAPPNAHRFTVNEAGPYQLKAVKSTNGEYFECFTDVTVVGEAAVARYDITPPTKLSYYTGDTLDMTGLVVKQVMTDDTEIDITADCTTNPANGTTVSTAGNVTVRVLHRGVTLGSFSVTVAELEIIDGDDWWTLYNDGTLRIFCEGDMPFYESDTGPTAPWFDVSYEDKGIEDIVEKIIIGPSVTSIGAYAFYGFNNNIEVTIPESVTKIEYGAFSRCVNMESITIPESVTYIDREAFDRCGITSITIPNSVTIISDYMFYYCRSLASVTIPNSVTYIGTHAFDDCTSLASITIPSSVTDYGNDPFTGCTNLTSVTIEYGVENVCSFAGCTSLANVTIPNSVTYLQGFSGCTSLSSINIPNSVTTITDFLFSGCTSLSSVNIPNSVTTIGYSAFVGCTSLENVTIPSGVTSVESRAFKNCTGITGISIPGSILNLGEEVFTGCTSLTSVIIEYGATSIWSRAFSGLTALLSITIPNSVTTIGYSAFYGCTRLSSITIPNSVTTIGSFAFYGCTRLSSITIPNSVTDIGEYVFSNCTGIISVSIPNSITTISNDEFHGCTSLVSVTIENGVTEILRNAFYGCTNLAGITIPKSVLIIGPGAFYNTALTYVTINRTASVGTNAFPSGCTINYYT